MHLQVLYRLAAAYVATMPPVVLALLGLLFAWLVWQTAVGMTKGRPIALLKQRASQAPEDSPGKPQ